VFAAFKPSAVMVECEKFKGLRWSRKGVPRQVRGEPLRTQQLAADSEKPM
jgi:hypothetical protein